VILLDTHPLIWFSQGDERLGRRTRDLIIDCGERNEVLLSPISFWEAAMLVRKGRVSLGMSTHSWAIMVQESGRMHIAGLSPTTGVDAGELPDDIHGDPADRLLIATARLSGCALVTADRKILGYARAGHVQAIDARL
jgi:PIN domain nuclease of toxin-antitoxin system